LKSNKRFLYKKKVTVSDHKGPLLLTLHHAKLVHPVHKHLPQFDCLAWEYHSVAAAVVVMMACDFHGMQKFMKQASYIFNQSVW
jgi:hypothetical protein